MPQANPEWLKSSFYFFEKSGGSGRGGFLRLGSSLFALQIFLATLLLNALIGLLAHIGLYITNTLLLFDRTMVIRAWRFNLYLAGMLLVAVLAGCKSPERQEKKRVSTLRIHLQTNLTSTNRTETISVFREQPMRFQIERVPIVSEGDLLEASTIDVIGGFAIRLKFDQRGSRLLEEATGKNPGKHLVIFSQFAEAPDYHLNTGRWLAAPRIEHRISDGLLQFTPDATREESDAIVKGLNNVATKIQGKPGDF
jgi:hypothetical protein